MATIPSSSSKTVFSIKEWLGLNENEDGDTRLKYGEAAEMRNFRITSGKSLQIRPGTKTVVTFPGDIRGMWRGKVEGEHVTVCAAGGKLWLVDVNAATTEEIGELTDADTFFFGYSKYLYIMNGHEYMVWHGDGPAVEVEGYRPIVSISVVPSGGGTSYESANRLNGMRRAWFSPDGTSTVFHLPDKELLSVDYVKDRATDEDLPTTDYTTDTVAGTVTFTTAPAKGTNTLEIAWTISENYHSQVAAMRFSEIYNGVTDNRVFLYGDGSNKCIYSGLDYNGKATAEYFPDMNEVSVGESNTAITSLIRHYSRLLCFKENSAHSISYTSITLSGGNTIAGFYATPINRAVGNAPMGQVVLVDNNPRSLFGEGVYEWKSSSVYLTADERTANRISERVNSTLLSMNFNDVKCYDDNENQEYYVCYPAGAKTLVHNYEADAWYLYSGLPISGVINIENEAYVSIGDTLRHLHRRYRNDDGEPIDAFWRSGSMGFKQEWRRKMSSVIFVSLKPEAHARVWVTARSDRKADYTEKLVASSWATFYPVDFAHWSFNTNRRPQIKRQKIKVKKFALYQLVFFSNSTTATATILGCDIKLSYSGDVK